MEDGGWIVDDKFLSCDMTRLTMDHPLSFFG